MKIDRRRFLTLTSSLSGAIAAVSCTSSPPPTVVVPPNDIPSASADPTPTAAAAAAASASVPPDPFGEMHAPKDPQVDPFTRKPLTSSDNAAADDANFNPSQVKGQTCAPADNMKGSPSSCGTLKPPPGPTCESFLDTKAQCDVLKGWLKPRVAEKAVECHLAKSKTNKICKFNLGTECVIEALSSACIEPTAVATCNKVMTRCGPPHGNYTKLTEDSCEAAVSAVNDAHKAKFISCITESCRFETCVYHLIPTP